MENKEKKKYLFIEILRIVSCYAVVFHHTDAYMLFSEREPGSLAYWVYLFLSLFCVFAVPLFFMISGALLLHREESLKDIFVKRILKTFMILLVFSFGHYMLEVHSGEPFGMGHFLAGVIKEPWSPALWFLYAYIGIMIALPFLRAMVKNLKDEYFYYLFGIGVFLKGILPIISYCGFGEDFSALLPYLRVSWLVNDVFLCPCIGYFLMHRLNMKKCKKWLPKLWIMNLLSIGIAMIATYYKGTVDGNHYTEFFHKTFDTINCITIFVTIRYFFEKKEFSKGLKKLIMEVGSCTFGIYLIHLFVRKMLQIFDARLGGGIIPTDNMPALLLYGIIIWVISLAIAFVIRRIPILRKLIS